MKCKNCRFDWVCRKIEKDRIKKEENKLLLASYKEGYYKIPIIETPSCTLHEKRERERMDW